VEKGSTIRFNNTDQSARPIPFIQGGGTITGFSSSITARAIYVKVAELLNGEFMHVNGELVLPADTTVKIVDPENLNAETFGNVTLRQRLSSTEAVAHTQNLPLPLIEHNAEKMHRLPNAKLSLHLLCNIVLVADHVCIGERISIPVNVDRFI
jgi:hypothetical protein